MAERGGLLAEGLLALAVYTALPLLARRGFKQEGDYQLPERLVASGTVALVLVLGVSFVAGPGAKPPLPR